MEVEAQTIQMDRDMDAPVRAREWVNDHVQNISSSRRRDLFLLTHELVVNSVEHADGSSVWVSVIETDDMVRVTVTDEGAVTVPAKLPNEPFATSGNGLRWVASLADHWGRDCERQTSVWFEIDYGARDTG